EAAALEAKKHAEQAMENQGGDFDYSRAMSQLAIAAGQLRAIQQIREKLGKR
ncbi:MAG: F0F1 ATP synthase subunit epsilon, partial [Thalassolituus oleivorans]|nr:F0F1 ATP synthase subunit epsilon [Thalassolituus oleivorans]